MMLENFISKVDGQIVSSDEVPANAGQPVQLIAEWCKYIGLPFQWSSPAYWWDDFDSTFPEYWKKIDQKAAGNPDPQPGDIVIFSSDLPGSGSNGHASIFLRTTGEYSWEGLDALWGGKSAHRQSHTWAYVLGWFTPKNRAVLEGPTPTAIADEAPYAAFDMQIIGAKIVTALRQPTTLYNLNDVSYESLLQNPVSHVPMGFEITVTAVAKHRLGGTYYMPDNQKAEGYLLEDCEDYETVTPADKPDPEAEEKSEVTNLTPENVLPAGIFSPLSAPNMNNTIVVNKRISYYNSMSNALNRVQECGTLAPTTYFIYKRVPSGMLSVTSKPGQSMRTWINPGDLKDPEPEAPFNWEKELITYEQPRYYIAKVDGFVTDMDEVLKSLPIKKDQFISIDGEITTAKGIHCAVPSATRKAKQHYVIPLDMIKVKPTVPNILHLDPVISESILATGNFIDKRIRPSQQIRVTPLPELPLSAKLYLWIKERFKQKS